MNTTGFLIDFYAYSETLTILQWEFDVKDEF